MTAPTAISRPTPRAPEPVGDQSTQPTATATAADPSTDLFGAQVAAMHAWLEQPRFAHIVRLHTARDIVAQQGAIPTDHAVARDAAEGMYARLRERFVERRQITTFGPYSPGQAVVQKRAGLEAIYLGGWATSAKGSQHEDPGPDLASYPLSAVPDEAAAIVRALLTADRNQHFARSRMTAAERAATPEVDFRPFVIADADTGHGGDAHVRNLIRRFVEVGIPGYHIEDQRPGAKKCGHQDGKVLVAQAEQNKRLNAARFQLDIMRVPGIVVARTDAEAATLIDDIGDERDQPFVLGATNPDVPAFRLGSIAILHHLHDLGLDEVRGHLLFALPARQLDRATAWLDRMGLLDEIDDRVHAARRGAGSAPIDLDGLLDAIDGRFVEVWQHAAGVMTVGEALVAAAERAIDQGLPPTTIDDGWRERAGRSSVSEAHAMAADLGLDLVWDAEAPRTPDGFYRVRGGIDYAIAKSLAAAPFADLLWMETKTADLADARRFAEAIHAVYPDQMLAYNLSPSFNWDTTGMSDDEMRRFPAELGALGYVFGFITYGGHQLDGLGTEEFATSLRDDGMLALARLQRRLRLIDSPYQRPQALVGGDRLDAALSAATGRTASTRAMGKGSTHHQHLVPVEAAPAILAGWLRSAGGGDGTGHPWVRLDPVAAGSDQLELHVGVPGAPSALVIGHTLIGERAAGPVLVVASVRRAAAVPVSWTRLALVYLLQRSHATTVHALAPTAETEAVMAALAEAGVVANPARLPDVALHASVDPAGLAAAVAEAMGAQRPERRPEA